MGCVPYFHFQFPNPCEFKGFGQQAPDVTPPTMKNATPVPHWFLSDNRHRAASLKQGAMAMESHPKSDRTIALEVLHDLGISHRVGQLEYNDLLQVIGLSLSNCQIYRLPARIEQLTNLRTLRLPSNRLSQLPAEILNLGALETLDLADNELSQLPAEIGDLHSLKWLDLRRNPIKQLPIEIARLTHLEVLLVDAIQDWIFPPPEIVKGTTSDILAFLREQMVSPIPRYEAKLLIVGEGQSARHPFCAPCAETVSFMAYQRPTALMSRPYWCLIRTSQASRFFLMCGISAVNKSTMQLINSSSHVARSTCCCGMLVRVQNKTAWLTG